MSKYELYAKIGGDSSGLQKAMGNAQKSIGLTSDRMQKLRTAGLLAFKGLAAGASAAVGTLTALTVSGLRTVDSQAKMARSIGASIDGLRGLQIAAGDAGIQTGELGVAMQMMNARLAEAARGGTASAKAIERMGLDANELVNMDVDERIATMADQMQAMGFSAAQAQDELNQLGIRNRNLAILMIQGGDAIRAARQEVDDYGLSVSQVDAARIERANDAFSRIGRTIEGVRIEMAIYFAPILEEVAERIKDVTRESGGFRSIVAPALDEVIMRLAGILDAINGTRVNLLSLQIAFKNLQIIALSAIQPIVSYLRDLADAASMFDTGIFGDSRKTTAQLGVLEGRISEMANNAERDLLTMQNALFELRGNIESGVTVADALVNALARIREARSAVATVGEQVATSLSEPIQNSLSTIEEFGLQAARNIQDSFANFLINPFKEGLKGMLKAFVDMLNQMVAQIIAKKVLTAFFSQFTGGNGPMAAIANAFIGKNETGGPMMARQPYMVGEKGPEMVVPSKSSYVVPNNKLGGGGGVSLNVSINAEDPGAEGRIRTMVQRELAPQIIEAAMGRTMSRLSRPSFA